MNYLVKSLLLLISMCLGLVACNEDDSIATMTVTSSEKSFGSSQGYFSPEDRAELEKMLYDQWKTYHIPFGQTWTTSFKTKNNSDIGTKCECVEANATASKPYCGDEIAKVLEGKVSGYAGTGDGAGFTGHTLAMLAYKLAATHDPTVFEDLKTVLSAIETLFAVTGQKGLLARAFIPPGSDQKLDGENIVTNSSSGPHESKYNGYKWSGDVSRDQYAGIMFGLWAAWTMTTDEQVRSRVAKLVKDVAEVLMDNNHTIPREKGYLNLSFKPGILESSHAIYLIAYIEMAWLMTGEQKFKDHYQDITTDSGLFDIPAINIAADMGTNDPTLTSKCHYRGSSGDNDSYFRFTIIMPEIFMLNMMSEFGGHSDVWKNVNEVMWNGHNGTLVSWPGLRNDHNALFDIMYLVAKNGGDYDYTKMDTSIELDSEASADALSQLAYFDKSYRRKIVVMNDLEELKGCKGTAKTALNMDMRGSDDYVWQKSPYRINYSCHQPWVEHAGIDYLLTYWMARYYGYFKSPTLKLSSVTSSKATDGKLTIGFNLSLQDWIPATAWEITDNVNITIYNGDQVVWNKPVTLPSVLTWADSNARISFSPSIQPAGGTYKIRVTKYLYNIPTRTYPGTTFVYLDVWSDGFSL